MTRRGPVARPPGLRISRLGVLLTAGIVDSCGLAFGWTVFLLVVTERGGLSAAAVQSAAMMVGVALSAPFSAWLSPRVSPRRLLRLLAGTEASCRMAMFLLLAIAAPDWLLAPVVVALNVFAWSGFAAMRSEVARAVGSGGAGRSLTWYAVAIAAAEALASAVASLLVGQAGSEVFLAVTSVVYVASLVPQWIAGRNARTTPFPRSGRVLRFADVARPCGLGAAVFVVASAPALLATALAYEAYGPSGAVVSAAAFALGSLGSARVQARIDRWASTSLAACCAGAVLVGGWTVSGLGLAGLAVAAGLSGLAQCALEGDMDARAMARVGPAGATTALALASSSRALGGAVAVSLLPVVVGYVPLAEAAAVACGLLLLAAGVSPFVPRRRRPPPLVWIPRQRSGPAYSAALSALTQSHGRVPTAGP